MFAAIKQLFGFGPKVDYAELMSRGALIIDVRSKGEYSGGHIKGSVNIPLDRLSSEVNKLKDKNKPIITCCASGMRSASAKSILKSAGISEVYNGGSWAGLKSQLK